MRLEPSASIRNILQLLPEMGSSPWFSAISPLERLWRVQLEREFAEFGGRISFRWLNDLSLPQMQRAVASLPAKSAVYYGALYVDAAGVPHEQDGLPTILAASRSSVFGMYEEQLGVGIVSALAFGFAGLFIGPTLLAVNYNLFQEWLTRIEA